MEDVTLKYIIPLSANSNSRATARCLAGGGVGKSKCIMSSMPNALSCKTAEERLLRCTSGGVKSDSFPKSSSL